MKNFFFYGFAIIAIGFLLYLNFRPKEGQEENEKVIAAKNAPAPIGPYSQAIRKGNCVFVSGQVGIDKTGKLDTTGIAIETSNAMENIRNILDASHLKLTDIASTTIYLTDLKNFQKVNEAYGKFFEPGNYPARSTVQVAALPKGAHVEISVIAVKD
jgi:2-iminobutanoate/2-iminopropanoate deaminase